ncbi:TfuA-like protein [Sorangium atrum]|uniref:TfuA-like protein n=1 Tax=Sorangium atrum TaxID=2995308 RepID=A0ABT5C514_9BACT|nr:TfuA-like protein [Sorangium aterium]MDC0680272.1 TfuA-like protein [Sorangium aterium]
MIVLFTGPSLPPAEVPGLPELRVLPPVAQGDVYRAARERPWGIGIVDGFFEHVPSVWHKEILWAMSQGVHVFGASSMGALRAAELADFGMVGVGRIFEQVRSGALGADDEVAVAHASAEHGYRCTSEALVNIRATLGAAVEAKICDPALAERLVAISRALFYPDRTWPAVLQAARAAQEAPHMLDALKRWLPAGRVDQKRLDALAMIEAMQAARAMHRGPLEPGFIFQRTDVWERALDRMRAARLELDPGADVEALLDELRLLGDEPLYTRAIQGALLRGLAEEAAERNGVKVGPGHLERTAMEFRRERGLYTGPSTRAWLGEQGLDAKSFADMMAREAKLRWTAAVCEPEVRRHLVDQLRAMGCYGRLEEQARAKQAVMAGEGLDALDLAGSGVSDTDALWRWYFTERLGKPVPEDLETYAARFGFASVEALLRSVLIERWCTRLHRIPDIRPSDADADNEP